MDRIPDLLLSALRVFAAMSPWLVAGFFAAGVLAVWIPRAWVNRALGGRTGLSGVLRAVLVGVPLPICSCGVLPIAAGLRRNGAGKGATAAFLISTPQTGVDSILATYALMGPVFAVARPLAAALTGLVGGAVVAAVGGEDDAAATAADEPPPPSRGLREILRQAYVRLLGSVAKPLAAGLAVSALVTVLVPDGFFAEAFGGRDWLAMPAMALVGLPMYVCSTASIPIAASLMLKGVSPGAAFVFLMVGPAMNAVSVTTVAALRDERGVRDDGRRAYRAQGHRGLRDDDCRGGDPVRLRRQRLRRPRQRDGGRALRLARTHAVALGLRCLPRRDDGLQPGPTRRDDLPQPFQ